MTTTRTARRPIRQPGVAAGDLREHLGLDDPALQHAFRADLARVRDAEMRAETQTEGIRLR